MEPKVGIPAGLYYYRYYSLWETFFTALGVEVIKSPPTNRQTLLSGKRYCVDEACFPVKLYYGHVMHLKDLVDYLFIPRLTSIAHHEYICPKMGGLPDMIRQTIPDLPPIIDVDINLRRSRLPLWQAAYKVGSYFTSDPLAINSAFRQAKCAFQKSQLTLRKKHWPQGFNIPGTTHSFRIVLLGHVYTLNDSFNNMNILTKLTNLGVTCYIPDNLHDEIIDTQAATLPKKIFWSPGRRIIGSAFHYLQQSWVDGVIYLMNFGCGVDSFVSDLIQRRVNRTPSPPFMILTLDEHSGEAGLNTRIEAFIDMIAMHRQYTAESRKESI